MRKTLLALAFIVASAPAFAQDTKLSDNEKAWGAAMDACLAKACGGWVVTKKDGHLTGYCPGSDHEKNVATLDTCSKEANASIQPTRWAK